MYFNERRAIEGVVNGTSLADGESRDLLWPAFASLNATVAVVGVLGNLLVVGSYVSSSRLANTVSNVLVATLACIDLVSCILVIPPAVWAQWEGFWPLPSWACDLHCILNYTTIIASMATIAVISIERQLAVTSPAFHHSRVTKKILLKIEIVLFAVAMLIASVPSAFQWVKYDKWEGVCAIDWFTYQAALIYVISAFLGCFTIPSLMTLIANLKIIRVSYGTSKRRGTQVNAHTEIVDSRTNFVTDISTHDDSECDKNSNESSSTESVVGPSEIPLRLSFQSIKTQMRDKSSRILTKTKLTRTPAPSGRSELHRIIVRSMSIVTVMYFVCMTPFSVTKLIKMATMREDIIPNYINLLATLSQFIGSAANPFIYFLLRRDFRAAICQWIWQCRSSVVPHAEDNKKDINTLRGSVVVPQAAETN